MRILLKQQNFNSGIISTLLSKQDELALYKAAVSDSVNILYTKYGPATKRQGTMYIGKTKYNDKKSKLFKFSFNINQNIILEIGHLYIRFITFDQNGAGYIPDPVTPTIPYEISTLIQETDLNDLRLIQSADVVYITHKTRGMFKLSRIADNNWTISSLLLVNGPFEDLNVITTKTLQASGTTGSITITASGHTPFVSTDVGRLIRIDSNLSGISYGYVKITGYTNSSQVTASVITTLSSTSATYKWAMGSFSNTTGYPTTGCIHQQRLFFAGNVGDKQTIYSSKTNSFEDFSPSDVNGDITDSHALRYSIASEQVDEITWIKSGSNTSLLIGTTGAEWRLYSAGAALTPADRVAEKQSAYGSLNHEPLNLDDGSLVFIQHLQRKLRNIEYDYASNKFKGPDLTLIAENLTLGGIKQLAYQKQPFGILYALKEDGTLLSMTYDKDQKVYAWGRHNVNGIIENILTLPDNVSKQDTLFMTVKRNINNVDYYYIEQLSKVFDDNVLQQNSVFLDSHLRYTGAETNVITGLNYLEGKLVTVVSNGALLGDYTVTSGSIILDDDIVVTDCFVGIPYDCYITTLNKDIEDIKLSTKNDNTNIHKVLISVYRSGEFKISQDFEDFKDADIVNIREFNNNMDTPITYKTDDFNVKLKKSWRNSTVFTIYSTPGLPFTLLSYILEVLLNE